MLYGTAASSRLQQEYGGLTIHRRSVQVHRFFIDLHLRVREGLLGTTTFSGEGYLTMLGKEMGSMPAAVFDSVVSILLETLRLGAPGGEIDGSTFLGQFPADFGLYSRLTDSVFYRSLRFMMGKFISNMFYSDLINIY